MRLQRFDQRADCIDLRAQGGTMKPKSEPTRCPFCGRHITYAAFHMGGFTARCCVGEVIVRRSVAPWGIDDEGMQLPDVPRDAHSQLKARSLAAGVAPEIFDAAVAAIEGEQLSASRIAQAAEAVNIVTALIQAASAAELLNGVSDRAIILLATELSRNMEPPLTARQRAVIRRMIQSLDLMISV